MLILLLYTSAMIALGFGAGRVKHPANLKLSAVKTEVGKIEAGVYLEFSSLTVEARTKALEVIHRLKSIL